MNGTKKENVNVGYRSNGRNGGFKKGVSGFKKPAFVQTDSKLLSDLLSTKMKIEYSAIHNFLIEKLQYSELDQLAVECQKIEVDIDRGSKFLTISTCSDDEPSSLIDNVINLYKSLPLSEENSRLNINGQVTIDYDFSSVLRGEYGAAKYPFGIVFIADNGMKNVVRCSLSGFNDVDPRRFKSFNIYDSASLRASSTGIFRTSGKFIIFFANNEFEKEEGKFYPEMTMITIDVFVLRGEHGKIRKVGINNISIKSDVVFDDIQWSLDKIFLKHNVNRYVCSDYIYLVGGDPKSYALAPSHVEEDSYLFNKVVVKKEADTSSESKKKKTSKNNAQTGIDYISEQEQFAKELAKQEVESQEVESQEVESQENKNEETSS